MLMIYLQTIGRYWDPGAKFLNDQSEKSKRNFQIYLAKEYVRLIKLSIDTQRQKSKWVDLTPGYLEYKRRHGLSTNIWEATGELKESLQVFPKGRVITVGFDGHRNHSGTKLRLMKLARILEYGTLRIPPRPLFRPVYTYMSKNINYFWEKYQKEGESK